VRKNEPAQQVMSALRLPQQKSINIRGVRISSPGCSARWSAPFRANVESLLDSALEGAGPLARPADGHHRAFALVSTLKKGRKSLDERPPPAFNSRRPRLPRIRVMGMKSFIEQVAPSA